ncbi:MAG: hypothetical protein V3T17_16230 [Pseudomonadales bacterium]
MDIFNIVVGIFSTIAAIAAICSFVQATKAKNKSAEIQIKIIKIEKYISSLEAKGGNIKVGGKMKVGGSVRTHGGSVVNEP